MYRNLIDLFKENEGKGAVGAFNVHCFEMLPAMVQAAEELWRARDPSDFSRHCQIHRI